MLILAGPNGAGKTTLSKRLYYDVYDLKEFVNADYIASGLSPYNPDQNAIEAGKVMLRRIRQLLDSRVPFGFETTLSGKIRKKRFREDIRPERI